MFARLCVLGLFMCTSLGCTPRYVRNWSRLHPGLTASEVQLLLGTPDAQVGPLKLAATRPSDLLGAVLFWHEAYGQEVWVYGPPGFFSGLKSLFGPAPDAYVVYFDEQRKVTHWREPLPSTQQASAGEDFHLEILRGMARPMIAHDPSAKLVDPEDPARGTFNATTQPICSAPRDLRASRQGDGTVIVSWDPPVDLPRTSTHPRYWVVALYGDEQPRPSSAAIVAAKFPFVFETPETHLVISDDVGACVVCAVSDDGGGAFSEPVEVGHRASGPASNHVEARVGNP